MNQENKYNLTKEKVLDLMNLNQTQRNYLDPKIIMLCVSGSNAYGFATKDSDVDVRGLFVADPINIIGDEKIDQFNNTTNDITIYEFKKAIHLIAECNPNMIELLWEDKEDIIFATREYWDLRLDRDQLLSSLARFKFSGYAMSQLKRIRGHNKWLIQEQEGKISINKQPKIESYCKIIFSNEGITKKFNFFDKENDWMIKNAFLTKESETVYKIWQHYSIEQDTFIGKNQGFRFQENKPQDSYFVGILIFDQNNFDYDNNQWHDYKTWKENRNEYRNELEQKHGYDTKHASHLYRLFMMGKEILEEHVVKVKRPDADQILAIRNGAWSYEKVIQWAEDMDKNILENLYKTTTLRKKVDKLWLNAFIVDFYFKYWRKNERTN